MVFHTYGNKENSAVIFIHGMFTPYSIWNKAVQEYAGEHYVIVPELDGHTEDEASTFISVDDEVKKLEVFISSELNGKVYLLAGLSMGGRIVSELAKSTVIKIENLDFLNQNIGFLGFFT